MYAYAPAQDGGTWPAAFTFMVISSVADTPEFFRVVGMTLRPRGDSGLIINRILWEHSFKRLA